MEDVRDWLSEGEEVGKRSEHCILRSKHCHASLDDSKDDMLMRLLGLG